MYYKQNYTNKEVTRELNNQIYHHNKKSPFSLLPDLPHGRPRRWVDSRRRLVQDDHLGPPDEGDGHAQPPTQTLRQLAAEVVAVVV